ncbi:MAG: hypothetical protein BAJALOKI1v1_10029 [Promethearchaeota archaeon]|nr:MAG: hypothetical protein BAJALOKI1v1_10029 [Candidatus Lokiarchaeota archaeon]
MIKTIIENGNNEAEKLKLIFFIHLCILKSDIYIIENYLYKKELSNFIIIITKGFSYGFSIIRYA